MKRLIKVRHKIVYVILETFSSAGITVYTFTSKIKETSKRKFCFSCAISKIPVASQSMNFHLKDLKSAMCRLFIEYRPLKCHVCRSCQVYLHAAPAPVLEVILMCNLTYFSRFSLSIVLVFFWATSGKKRKNNTLRFKSRMWIYSITMRVKSIKWILLCSTYFHIVINTRFYRTIFLSLHRTNIMYVDIII